MKNWFPLIAAALLLATAPLAAAADTLDWPTRRGPQQNHQSPETGLIESWDPRGGEGSNLLWKRDDLGTRSTPIVMDGQLFLLVRDKPGTPNEGEKVVCLDAASGETQWEHRFNVYLSDVPDTRVAWSTCVGDPQTGRVYAQGVCGYFCCLEGKTGKVVWERSLHEEFGLLSTFGGRTNMPLVFEDLVLASAVVIGWGDKPEFGSLAKPAHRFMAFDKATGELRWLNGTNISPFDTTYSTPTIAVIGGEQQLVFGSGDGQAWGLQPRTGARLWHYPFSRRGLDASPLVVGDRVYMTQNQENLVGTAMGGFVALDATMRGDLTKKEIWRKYQVLAGKNSPLMVAGQLWVVDDGAKLQIFDPENGNLLGRRPLGRVMRSTPLAADGKVYVCTNGGRWSILEPAGGAVRIKHKLTLRGEANDGSPIVSHGRIYLPTSDALYCLGRPDAEPAADPTPPAAVETPVADDQQPALVQVSPYDALLGPGGKQPYTVRVYNSRGQLLRQVPPGEAKFTVAGPGAIGSGDVYTAPSETPDSAAAHTAALVQCQVGDISGSARVRIVPPLPWKFDFNSGDDLPVSWVGGRVRYVLHDLDGEQVAMKRDLLPTPRDPNNKLGTRSRMWMGPTDLANYTVQADVRITEKNGRLPDVGLINSRYTLTIRTSNREDADEEDTNRELRAYSWSPHDYRTAASVPFDSQPGVWYRMKLRVVPQATQALVQGKIWQRDNAEPDAWTVEMVDAFPNLSGSPGLYGNSQEAPFYVDNLSVIPNE